MVHPAYATPDRRAIIMSPTRRGGRAMGVGQRVPMVDAVQRVTGRISYVLNLELPGMLVGRILRSPHPHARIVRIDATAARKIPGVVSVVTRDDLTGDSIDPFYGPLVRDQPVLAMERARYAGEAIAAVAAVDELVAQRALDLIEVEYEELAGVFDALEALAVDAPIVQGETNLHDRFEVRHGDIEAGFSEADVIVEREYH